MPECYADLIRSIDPDVDVEFVGDIANDTYRYFSEMSRDDWVDCVQIAAAMQ